MTNADKIRAMTDEELALYISERIDCAVCRDDMKSKECPAVNWRKCENFWLDWLKQEVKDV